MNQQTTNERITTISCQLECFARKNAMECEEVSNAGVELAIQYNAQLSTLQQMLNLMIVSKLPQINKELDRIEDVINIALLD